MLFNILFLIIGSSNDLCVDKARYDATFLWPMINHHTIDRITDTNTRPFLFLYGGGNDVRQGKRKI